MDQILDIPQAENRIFNYAGFWIRVGAALVDGVILWVVNAIIELIYTGSFSLYDTNVVLTVVSIILGVLYYTLMESSERQATLGKMAVGIKVGDAHGNRISVANALGRYFAKILSAIILGIGYLMVAWDDRKQGLHDKIADTYVFEN